METMPRVNPLRRMAAEAWQNFIPVGDTTTIRHLNIYTRRTRGVRVKERKSVYLSAETIARREAKRKRKRQMQRQARRIERFHRK